MFSFCRCENPIIKADWVNGVHCDKCKLPEGPNIGEYPLDTSISPIVKEDKELSPGITSEELRRRLG